MTTRLRCLACDAEMPGPALDAHFDANPLHRHQAFGAFVEDHPERLERGAICDGATRIVPTWDQAERERFPRAEAPCRAPIVRCGCANTMCAHHGITCDTCGRFACLRHRHSGHCLDCGPGRRRQHVAVPKHDPFTRETKLVSRTYMRPGPGVWERARPRGRT